MKRSQLAQVSVPASKILVKNYDIIMENYEKFDKDLIDYTIRLLNRKKLLGSIEWNGQDILSPLWRESPFKGNKIFLSGLYQIYRREKTIENKPDVLDHSIGCEVIYVDSERMRCMLIGTNYRIYIGTIYINADNIAYFVLARSDDREIGAVFRFISVKLFGRTQFYSALMLKAGRITKRPISCDCLAVYIPEPQHAELYASVANLAPYIQKSGGVPEDSIIRRYISEEYSSDLDLGTEHENLKVRDVELCNKIVSNSELFGNFFREPSRTLAQEEIIKLARLNPLGIFRKSD